MKEMFLLAMGLFLAGILAATHFARVALRQLGDRDRAALVTIAASGSLLNLVIPLAIGLLFVVCVMMNRALMVPATLGALAVLFVHAIVTTLRAHGAYCRHGFPAGFMRAFIISRSCRLAGFAVLIAGVVLWLAFGQSPAQPH